MKKNLTYISLILFTLICLVAPQGFAYDKIVWPKGQDVLSSDADGSNVQYVLDTFSAEKLTVVDSLGKVYWKEGVDLVQADLDGTAKTVILQENLGGFGVANDGRVFYSKQVSSGPPTYEIWTADANGANATKIGGAYGSVYGQLRLDNGLEKVYFLAVPPEAPVPTRHLNWVKFDGSVSGTESTYTNNLPADFQVDKNTGELVVSFSGKIAVDSDNQKKYAANWTESGIQIVKANYDGSSEEVIVADSNAEGFMSFSDSLDKLYFRNPEKSILACDADGANLGVVKLNANLPYLEEISLSSDNEKIYLLNKNTDMIQRCNVDGTQLEDVMTSTTNSDYTISLAVDNVNGHIYIGETYNRWTSAKVQIKKVDLDGTNPVTLIPSHTGRLSNLQVDPLGGKLYWADKYSGPSPPPGTIITDDIKRANLDGSSVETILSDIAGLKGLALDTLNGKIYWTAKGDLQGAVNRADLDGTNVENIVSVPITLFAINVDPGVAKVLYSDATNIYQANTDGTNREVHVADAGAIESILLVNTPTPLSDPIAFLNQINTAIEALIVDPNTPYDAHYELDMASWNVETALYYINNNATGQAFGYLTNAIYSLDNAEYYGADVTGLREDVTDAAEMLAQNHIDLSEQYLNNATSISYYEYACEMMVEGQYYEALGQWTTAIYYYQYAWQYADYAIYYGSI